MGEQSARHARSRLALFCLANTRGSAKSSPADQFILDGADSPADELLPAVQDAIGDIVGERGLPNTKDPSLVKPDRSGKDDEIGLPGDELIPEPERETLPDLGEVVGEQGLGDLVGIGGKLFGEGAASCSGKVQVIRHRLGQGSGDRLSPGEDLSFRQSSRKTISALRICCWSEGSGGGSQRLLAAIRADRG